MKPKSRDPLYGLLAEFEQPEALVQAVQRSRERGFRRMETYTPFSIEALNEAMENPPNKIPLITLCGGIFGFCGAWVLQYYVAVFNFPINVGGRPLNSWPAFIPIMFEMTVLCAALSCFFGLWITCGLPRPHHPLFNAPQFQFASRDRFFLCIESADPLFSVGATRDFMYRLDPSSVSEVEW